MEIGKYTDGRDVTYDEASKTFSVGGSAVTIDQVLGYDAAGQITWSSDQMRTWAYDYSKSMTGTAGQAASATAQPTETPQSKKSNKTLIIVIAVVAILVLCSLCGVIGLLGGSDDTAEEPVATETVEEQAEPVEETEPAEEEPAPEPEPATWTEVISFEGNANKRSETFTLSGEESRLTYTVEGSNMPVFTVYVMDKGDSLEESGGFPEVMVTEEGGDTTMLAKSPGEYYLEVMAANCSWTVVVEER